MLGKRVQLGPAGDEMNTVEMVRIPAGHLAGGSFAVEVRPTAINAQAVAGLEGGPNRDFALYLYVAQ